ncbi:MAG: tRNA1(Val) (adenine(37)-N6)-methyltransferase [Bacilli bacterium]|nr:tRNA1(Val) (adenine(37)-N6)-methyltransferase [Bacilli bacterium]
MKVLNDLLGYNDLKIYQDTNWFRFSLDSVLLPNFVTLSKKTRNILDLGTGNAPIPMILSTMTEANIYGIEIQKDVFELAVESIKYNKLDKKIKIINDDMKNLDKYFDPNSFDVIISNPPYFKLEEKSKKNEDIHKIIARHEETIKVEDIIRIARKYLDNNGIFAMVHRTDRLIEIISLLKSNNLEPKRIQFIYPKENSKSNMFLIECRKNGNSGLKVERPLYIHNEDGSYLDEINELFRR